MKITLNRVKKHVSVEGRTLIRTCETGSLKYRKFQDIEKEVEDYTDDWLSKKLVASIVSSRIMGTRRRNEKRTTSSHERKTLFTDQQEKQINGKGGGRQGLRYIDGDVPLCMRSREVDLKIIPSSAQASLIRHGDLHDDELHLKNMETRKNDSIDAAQDAPPHHTEK